MGLHIDDGKEAILDTNNPRILAKFGSEVPSIRGQNQGKFYVSFRRVCTNIDFERKRIKASYSSYHGAGRIFHNNLTVLIASFDIPSAMLILSFTSRFAYRANV